MAPICWDEGLTDEDISEFVLDEMSIVLGLLSCCEGDGLYGVWTAPPMRNCDDSVWYMSGVGAVGCKLGGVVMYALYGAVPVVPYGPGNCENCERPAASIWNAL